MFFTFWSKVKIHVFGSNVKYVFNSLCGYKLLNFLTIIMQ